MVFVFTYTACSIKVGPEDIRKSKQFEKKTPFPFDNL